MSYIETITKASALVLGAIGLFWLGSSLLKGAEESEVDEARRTVADGKLKSRSFMVLLQLVLVEELEIFLILIPLILASHALEASAAATIGIVSSISMGVLLRKRFERFLAGKFRYLKLVSGAFLLALGIILFLEI